MRGLKVLVERQMRQNTETQEAVRATTSLITSEVCEMMKRYLNAKLSDFATGLEARLEARLVERFETMRATVA